MIRNAPTQSGIFTVLILSACFTSCRKESPDDSSSRAKPESSQSAEEEEANKKQATLQFIQLQEKDFRSRLKQAKSGNAELAHVRKFLK
jgi:hypothetical protein